MDGFQKFQPWPGVILKTYQDNHIELKMGKRSWYCRHKALGSSLPLRQEETLLVKPAALVAAISSLWAPMTALNIVVQLPVCEIRFPILWWQCQQLGWLNCYKHFFLHQCTTDEENLGFLPFVLRDSLNYGSKKWNRIDLAFLTLHPTATFPLDLLFVAAGWVNWSSFQKCFPQLLAWSDLFCFKRGGSFLIGLIRRIWIKAELQRPPILTTVMSLEHLYEQQEV